MTVRIYFVACVALFIAACDVPSPTIDTGNASSQLADHVYVNGNVYTGNSSKPWVESIATADGFVVALGSTSELDAFFGDETNVVDLGGRLVLPGLYDSHLHPIDGMAKELFQCNFPFTTTLEDAVAAVAACAEEHPDLQWIAGGQWNAGVFDTTIPSKEMLDAAVPDKPVYLSDATGHHAWVNSRALEVAGITNETEDPPGGTIVRLTGSRSNPHR